MTYISTTRRAVLEEKGELPPHRVECAAEFTLSKYPLRICQRPGTACGFVWPYRHDSLRGAQWLA